MKQPVSPTTLVLRTLENVEVFGNEDQKEEARFLRGAIQTAVAERHPRVVNFARRRRPEHKKEGGE